MRMIFAILVASVSLAAATTLEVLRVYQPLSFHGTDVDFDFEGQPVQAKVMSRPMVLNGAMPEALVSAIGSAHRIPTAMGYSIKECNLLALYGLKISGVLTEEAGLIVTIDLKDARVPADVDLPIRTVLKLSIESLKKTLNDYHHAENKPLKVKLDLAGLSDKTSSLRNLAGRFQVVGR